jgi:hypothetical protein
MLEFDSPPKRLSTAETLRLAIAAADLANREKVLKQFAGTADEQRRRRLLGSN